MSNSLPLPLVDSHCHLEKQTYGSELAEVMDRARAAGLVAFVAVGASGVAEGAREAVQLAQAEPDVWASVGIHPNEADGATPAAMDAIEALLAEPRVVALGEVGLDYYYAHADAAQQRRVFADFVRMARRADQPLMMHVRDAHRDCLAILDEVGPPPRGGMVHCFTAGPEEAAAYLARGLHLSIPGVVTFKNAAPLREAVPWVPADRLLIETDCPYLAPVPQRGKRNEPAFVAHTARAVAALRGVEAHVLAAQTTANARAFFGLDGGPRPAGKYVDSALDGV